MAKKHKSYPVEPTLDMGFDEMDAASQQENGPVTVLGMTFSNDEERRAYFREQLRAKLPELRSIEGFPIGSDDDIVNLSDPPYYTACPNPWLNDFIAEWEQEKLHLEAEGKRHPNVVVNEPYAADNNDIKNDSVYRSLFYHTKVPQSIIIRYLLHYTQPGDVVFDGFAGSGMTGLACQSCKGDNAEVIERGGSLNSNWGLRHGICVDLSPFACSLAYNINTPSSLKLVKNEATRILNEMIDEFGWLYKTKHSSNQYGTINCVVYSDIILCPNCGAELNLWEGVVDKKEKVLRDYFDCPHCGFQNTLKKNDLAFESKYDASIGASNRFKKIVPVTITYTFDGKRHEKTPDEDDLFLLQRIENYEIPFWFPTNRLPEGSETRRNDKYGITHVHHFYSKRNLIALSAFLYKISNSPISGQLRYLFTGMIMRSALVNKVHFTKYLNGGTDWDAGYLKGTLYVPPFMVESSVLAQITNKFTRYIKAIPYLPKTFDTAISNGSSLDTRIADNSIDYIFTDPPFGANINYSELNFIMESWLGVVTQNRTEAIQDTSKSLSDYGSLMSECFSEFFRILKPGKWMTVEFSNTSASVWRTIQNSLINAGFVVANVSALNKGQGGMRAVTTKTAVNQDLAISCFKPTEQLLYKFENGAPETNVWDFIDELLSRLPVHLEHSNKTTAVVERSPKILYDRLISFYVQHGFPVPLNAQEFQAGLRERYAERDGMYFTPSQAAKYDELRKHTDGFQASLFLVDSEQGGIAWLNNELSTPHTYQDLQPKWMQAINGVRKGDILPELMQILEENFIKESDGKWRKPNLRDDIDLAALRHKALMREFKVYVEVAQKPRGKIKEARLEALRAGFKQCYQDKDFGTIIAVGNRIPQNLLTEDEQLLQFYEIASSRV